MAESKKKSNPSEQDSGSHGQEKADGNLLETAFLTDAHTLLRVEECYRFVNLIRKRQMRRVTPFEADPEELKVLPWTPDELAEIITIRISKKRMAGLLIEKGRTLLRENPGMSFTVDTETEHTLFISIDRNTWADMKRDATTQDASVRGLATAYLHFALQLGPTLVNG